MRPLGDLVLTASGRIGRRAFIGCALGLGALWIGYSLVLSANFPQWVSVLLGLGLAYMAACIINQRLHDLGACGWWTALVMTGLVIAGPDPHSLQHLLGLASTTMIGLALCLARGQEGCNRYGPPPRRLAPLEQGRAFAHGTKDSLERGF